MITVYFDGICGHCAREIAYYQRIAPEGRFLWHDIARDATPLRMHGISHADALRMLHAQDDFGVFHQGVDAFILIWRQLAYWRMLAWLVALPPLRYTAMQLYRVFAKRRFARLRHCQLAAKNEKNAE